ncbi:MAG: hypothetical protein IKK20_00030, partial [Clostridia bacterium]|nr:hypothetical protein [Clostridia bacterium]
EGIVDKFLIAQFNTPKNLAELTNIIYETYKKRIGSNNSLNTLKNSLQKTNTSIANVLSAIERGIITDTTKQRLEDLESQKKDLEQKVMLKKQEQNMNSQKNISKTISATQ